ncbi:hypothetical protein [Deinococcus arenicola]|uniref:Uncharacterized protein n=1 Tax=Deinococcus arenicola TaxID=2994950 RepID=A0ABU4DM55_9DEIO|nr:hypothetical protein [Deinococcus sp. ZS9-10]MDV6373523.1 hypothetical protein [Deinococcus sp. ZS9-10]
MQETTVVGLSVRPRPKKRGLPSLDLGPFLMFFGISGVEHGKQERLDRQFELEHFFNLVTLTLNPPLGPGQYVLKGLPHEANKRGWTVEQGSQTASSPLSADGLEELREWMGGRQRRVQPEPFEPLI